MTSPQPRLYLVLILAVLLSGCLGSRSPGPDTAPDSTYEKAERKRWLSWHMDWEGTPHRLGGNSNQGIDCSAYVQRGYQELYRIKLPRTVKRQRQHGRRVKFSQLQTGDLVFFRQRVYPNHVGIYLGDGSFLHVSSSKGVIRSRLDRGYWQQYFSQGRRVQE